MTPVLPVFLAQPAVIELIFSDAEMNAAGLDKGTARIFYSRDGINWALMETSIRREAELNIAGVSSDRMGIFSLAADRHTLLLPRAPGTASGGW